MCNHNSVGLNTRASSSTVGEEIQHAEQFEKHVVKLAEENRWLDHAALKRLYDAHEVVVAVWRRRGMVVICSLKGHEYLRAQTKLGASGAKNIRAAVTAIPCTDSEHAKLLQRRLTG
jgi:hypothetical protein